MTGKKGIVAKSLLGSLLMTGLVVSAWQARPHTQRPYLHDNLYLPSGKFVSEASLGYHQLAADMVWFSAVQYYGGYRKEDHDLAYFKGLIDIVTELDPHFVFPYVFGAVVLSQDMGSIDTAIDLLKKGMAQNPEAWELPFEAGFLYYTDAKNPDMAARYFDLASRMPGGGDRAKRFAAFVYSKSGHTETSIRMWEELAETSDEPYMKELAGRYIEKLRAEVEAAKGDPDAGI
jgi:tetratricopeptide (TPR) repeat protein